MTGQGEIRPGHKQTEVGVIPEDWEVTHLGALVGESAPIRYGVVQIGPDVPGGVPIVPIKYVKEIATSPLHRSAKEIEGKFAGSRVKGSDVLISVKGTIGRVGIVPEGFEGNIAREIARIRLRSEIEPKFVAFQLEGGHTQQRINEAVVGTTRLEFSIAAVRDFEIALPSSLAEQRAIAAALADADGLIAALEGMIAKKRDLKQAAMQHLLTGKTRLPGFSGEWEVKRLGDIVRVEKGQMMTSSSLIPGDVPVIAGGRQAAYYHAHPNRRGPVVTISASGASAGFVAYHSGEIFASDCSTISEGAGYDLRYIYFSLILHQDKIYRAQTGGAQPHIHAKDINPMAFDFPPTHTEQTAIAELLSDLDADLAALEAQAAKARAVKQGMMQELLTGRVRLV